jgi:hypothetical protein
MFLGHMAVGLAARRARPDVSLGLWFLAAQLPDLVWPVFLLTGLEHVRITPGITAFTPLDFYDYPLTHSLVAGVAWASALAGVALLRHTRRTAAWLLGAVVLSHWILDVVSHRPDLPVLLRGPYVGLGLWRSVPATLTTELAMFAAGVALYVRSAAPGARRPSFWILMGLLVVAYAGAAFGPPPPDVPTLALTALSMWLLVAWAAWSDRPAPANPEP